MNGFTVVPRWTQTPGPGVGGLESRVESELAEALHRLANTLEVPLSSVLLAAHAKVLGALSGDDAVCTGYEVGTRPPLPLRLTLDQRSWRELVLDTARAEAALLKPKTAEALGGVETAFALAAGGGAELSDTIVLQVAFVRAEGGGSCYSSATAMMCSIRKAPPGSPAIMSMHWR